MIKTFETPYYYVLILVSSNFDDLEAKINRLNEEFKIIS